MTLEEGRKESYFNLLYSVISSWGEASLYNVHLSARPNANDNRQCPDELNCHCLFVIAES